MGIPRNFSKLAPGVNSSGIVDVANGGTGTSTGVPLILTPTNVSPANSATNIGATPTLTSSTYYSLYGISMAASQWQISTVSDFSTTVLNTGDVAGTAISYSVAEGVVSANTTYYWRVRYKDAQATYSEWSTGTSFTTATSFGPTVIGQAFGGGYYAGQISTTGNGVATHYLIIAPKATGQAFLAFRTSNATITGNESLIDGPTNTNNINNALYPAAQFCKGLSIGGYTDWYMPAQNELEVCYYNLKPTTNANETSSGANVNAVPSRPSNYSTGTPAQTSVSLFQIGNAEAFTANAGNDNLYWSSTFYSNGGIEQRFNTGEQFGNSINNAAYVRAVRRVPI